MTGENAPTMEDTETMIDVEAARKRLLDLRTTLLSTIETEEVEIDEIAGRTLAESLEAPGDVPEQSHATMDGFAVDATEAGPYEVVGETFPEDDPAAISSTEAVRIATGAPIPPTANAVIKREEASIENGSLRGPDVEPGTYVYERGSNVAHGELLFEAGERLSPKDSLLLGDLGIESVTVRKPFEVGLLATGTEIHDGRSRDLDSPMLAGLFERWDHAPTHEGSVPDDYQRVRDRIDRLADTYDVVVTTGGTSVGEKDYVVRALDALGEVLFHRVRIRPGKPIAVARLPDHDAVAVAIPGKPVGAHTVTTLVARPLFVGATPLPTVEAELTDRVGVGPTGFQYAIPVTLDGGTASPLGHVDSPLPVYEETFDPSVLSSSTRATRADGVVLTTDGLDAGESVDVVCYPTIER
ncbi:MAG: molybdopterin molybdotransferase MoeA [Natronomonas sp.]